MIADRGSLLRIAAGLAVAFVLAGGIASGQQPMADPDVIRTPYSGPGAGTDIPIEGAPASYDLRTLGRVTPIKNQGQCGSCWSFATYGSMESNILTQGGPARDLSENHLKNYHGWSYGPCAGGHIYMSMAYMARLDGPVDEASDPYNPWDDRPSPGGPREYTLRNVPVYDTVTEIKNAVMSDGGLHTSMYWDASAYNPADQTYYWNSGTGTNHAIDIVGWDDNKPTAAPAPGAWLMRNSWGPGWGQAGYFWISYMDTAGCKYGASFQPSPATDVIDVYDHDYCGWVSSLNTPYACNVYTTTKQETIGAVGIYTNADGASYDIRIYDTMGAGGPSTLLSQQTGSTATWGYHLIDLSTAVTLPAGDDFVIYLGITNGGSYPLAFDYRLAGVTDASVANPGESYYSFDNVNWTDLTSWDSTANFCIKGFTIPEPGTLSLLVLAGLAVLRRRKRS